MAVGISVSTAGHIRLVSLEGDVSCVLRTVHTILSPGLSSCSVGIAGSFNSCVFYTKAAYSLARERDIRARKMEEALVGVAGLAMLAGSSV